MKSPERMQVRPEELDALVERVKSGSLQEGDQQIIEAMAETIKFLSSAVQEKGTSIKRLLRMVFGVKTEKSTDILKDNEKQQHRAGSPADVKKRKKKPKGHGRNGAEDYPGAQRVKIAHKQLKPGDACLACPKGKVYALKIPGKVLWVVGSAPVKATVYELEKLRCNLCGKVYTADLPEECGEQKYDETAGSIIALLKYGSGFPFYRLEKLQKGFGIPLATSTQWEIVERKADKIYPLFDELLRQAAQGKVLHNDDTNMKILEFMKNTDEADSEEKQKRNGMFTTGILSQIGEHKVALYFTGRKHAGENMNELLAHRDSARPPPILMCDALSRNLPSQFKVILANCLIHARRRFVEVTEIFPEECRFVIETLQDVYEHDAHTKKRKMSDERRLKYHQRKSRPLMKRLNKWLQEQLDQNKVEPNSSLGEAITHMLKHWKTLTLFLKVPGAPLDNNLCEQVLKRAILGRKNFYFYKTQHGAYIGDLFMSIIHTCDLNDMNPYTYMTELERHSTEVFANPQQWLPWNHKKALEAAKEPRRDQP